MTISSSVNETELAEFLIAQVRDQATGHSEHECVRNYPRDVYFVGNLRPRCDPQPGEESQRNKSQQSSELLSKLAPVAFGAEFLLDPRDCDTVEIGISLHWACYYRIVPNLSQQREHQRHKTPVYFEESASPVSGRTKRSIDTSGQGEDDLSAEGGLVYEEVKDDSPEVVESAHDRRRKRAPEDTMFIRFRKISCHCEGRIVVTSATSPVWNVDISDLKSAIDQEVFRARQIALADQERICARGDVNATIHVPETALASDEAYAAFLATLTTEMCPIWQIEVSTEVYQTGPLPVARVLGIQFVNASPMPDNSPNCEAFLFDTEASIHFQSGNVQPFQLELAPKGFRYDRRVWGRGINCSVEPVATGLPYTAFKTNHTPVYRQMRFVTRMTPPARFEDLAQDPLPHLRAILQSMESYNTVWLEERDRYVLTDPKWESVYGVEFDRDHLKFREEIDLFRQGCELIRTDTDVRFAFQLTNETFRRGTKQGWRLFQIVFLVSQVPGIAALSSNSSPYVAERERVDIIYFPTGGGKTEAYLATMVFHCFFDRIRGKAAGVTAWTRFPLRLLTLQQTQRVADVILTADLVRQQQRDERLNGPNVDGFSVGYFVGQGGSPNEIVNPNVDRYASGEAQVIWSKVNDPDTRQDWKRVVRCPACGTATIRVDFDETHSRLIHKCTNQACAYPNGELPVYIVDNEIYRYLPSVIVGTIDKMAGIGNQRKFALLFGQVDGRCLLHGYYKGKCCQKDCSINKLQKIKPTGISGPTLFVQDELHLLKEGLGTFDGHYETFVQKLQSEYGVTLPLKIIASSATIEAFERQVLHLYGRGRGQARVFPGLGPTLEQSFYAETLDYPQRLFVGLIPHNKTIFNTILELVEMYHRKVQDLQRLPSSSPSPFPAAIMPGTLHWEQMLDLYATSLVYFLASRELNSIRTDLEGDVIPQLQRDGFIPFEVSELTGSVSTDEVSRVLEKLEMAGTAGLPSDSVLATSMVSHGVDVDRLNAVIFYGMPRQNAEYIQASSRVGRGHVGIVFNCLHPVRERDQSHYSYFLKFHEFLGRLVEPVAINRWSKFSVNRTLPGLFMGILLQLLANRSQETNPNRYYMLDFVRGKVSDGSIRAEDFVPILEAAYQVQNPTEPAEVAFKEEIHLRVRQYLDWILSPAAGQSFVSEVLIPKPMRSLRDVDEMIPVELDSLGSEWAGQR